MPEQEDVREQACAEEVPVCHLGSDLPLAPFESDRISKRALWLFHVLVVDQSCLMQACDPCSCMQQRTCRHAA